MKQLHRRRLSYPMKQKRAPLIWERDGENCYLCELGFSATNPPEYDHLNNDIYDNRVENLGFVHRKCNLDKRNNTDLQLKADAKLLQNEKWLSAREKAHGKCSRVEHPEGLTSSQEISYTNKPIVKEWLYQHVLEEGQVTLSEAICGIVNMLEKRTGTGSEQAVRRYINGWCTVYGGEFTKTKQDGKYVIKIRDEKQTIDNKICNKTVKN